MSKVDKKEMRMSSPDDVRTTWKLYITPVTTDQQVAGVTTQSRLTCTRNELTAEFAKIVKSYMIAPDAKAHTHGNSTNITVITENFGYFIAVGDKKISHSQDTGLVLGTDVPWAVNMEAPTTSEDELAAALGL